MLTIYIYSIILEKPLKAERINEIVKKLERTERRAMLDAWGWCTGTAQRDGMGREEGGGFGMGNTCIPVADSF